MNGIHDLGGMHGFGPVEPAQDEPVFHARWEATVVAINGAARAADLFNLDEFRHGIERMAPAHYLNSTYYEHWLDGITRLLIEKGHVDAGELEARSSFFEEHPDAVATETLDTAPAPEPPPERVRDVVREQTSPPRFVPGDEVRADSASPVGHTRLPRYARGKQGVVHRYHGVHVFPDKNAHGLGEYPQPLYSVRFRAQELWGASSDPASTVHLDLWESHLLPA